MRPSALAQSIFVALLMATAGTLPAAAQAHDDPQPATLGSLFPQAFVVEHQLIQADADGNVFYGEPVKDTYGGSWIVSERSDGSRLILDLSRRQMTEIQPAEGTYWNIDFDRLATLHARLVAADDAEVQRTLERLEDKNARLMPNAVPAPAPRLAVEEDPVDEMPLAGRTLVAGGKSAQARTALPAAATVLLGDPAVRHLRVTVSDDSLGKSVHTPPGATVPSAIESPPVLDVWVDTRVRLTPAARRALRALEQDVLGPPPSRRAQQPVTPSMLLAEAREHTDGALPVRTVRTLQARPELPESGAGVLEDVALSVQPLGSFPSALVQVPEGLRRVLHPMELMLRYAEDSREIRDAMAGGPLPDLDGGSPGDGR